MSNEIDWTDYYMTGLRYELKLLGISCDGPIVYYCYIRRQKCAFYKL